MDNIHPDHPSSVSDKAIAALKDSTLNIRDSLRISEEDEQKQKEKEKDDN